MLILKSKVLLIATILISAVSFHASAADDGKIYPGTMCQKSLGIGSYGGGTVRNDSNGGSLTVECPLVRDNMAGGIQDAEVRAYREDENDPIMCTINARSYYGTLGHQQYQWASNGGHYKTLSFSTINDYNNGAYYIWCAIPPSSGNDKSKVIGYRLDED